MKILTVRECAYCCLKNKTKYFWQRILADVSEDGGCRFICHMWDNYEWKNEGEEEEKVVSIKLQAFRGKIVETCIKSISVFGKYCIMCGAVWQIELVSLEFSFLPSHS